MQKRHDKIVDMTHSTASESSPTRRRIHPADLIDSGHAPFRCTNRTLETGVYPKTESGYNLLGLENQIRLRSLRPHSGARMCFSPEADFVGGVLVGGVGIATLAQARHKREIPLAVLPLAFAGHEVAEGFVWLGQRGTIPKSGGNVALYAYLFFAWALLPVLIPIAVRLVEPDRRRRRLMTVLVVLGSAVGAYLLWVVADHSITAHVAGNSIDYRGVGDIGDTVTVLYVVATCGTFVLSSSRRIVWFGVANLAAVAVIAEVKSEGLTSLWCFWAAIVSVLIYLHFRDLRRVAEQHEQPQTAPLGHASPAADRDPEVVKH